MLGDDVSKGWGRLAQLVEDRLLEAVPPDVGVVLLRHGGLQVQLVACKGRNGSVGAAESGGREWMGNVIGSLASSGLGLFDIQNRSKVDERGWLSIASEVPGFANMVLAERTHNIR